MLSRHQFTQKPRQFEPQGHAAGAQTLCARCVDEIFNSALHESLLVSRDEEVVTKRYSLAAKDVMKSMLEGCRWCSSIGNAVLTSANLDYWTNNWLGSHSDGDSMLMHDETNSTGRSTPDLMTQDDEQMPAAFNDGEPEDDELDDMPLERPGFLTINALDCLSLLGVTIDFIKWDDSTVFNLLKVATRVTGASDDGCILPEMNGDDDVRVTFEVISEGWNPSAMYCRKSSL